MSTLNAIVGLLAEVDAIVFLLVAFVVGSVALYRRRRPLTKSRAMDVASSSMLFVVLGMRYAVLAVLALAFPAAVVNGASPVLTPIFAGVYAAAAVVGFATHRGSVARRAVGSVVLVLVTIFEAVAGALGINQSIVGLIDTGLSVAIAGAACLFAAFFWTYRTATPNPLGSDKRPFDY